MEPNHPTGNNLFDEIDSVARNLTGNTFRLKRDDPAAPQKFTEFVAQSEQEFSATQPQAAPQSFRDFEQGGFQQPALAAPSVASSPPGIQAQPQTAIPEPFDPQTFNAGQGPLLPGLGQEYGRPESTNLLGQTIGKVIGPPARQLGRATGGFGNFIGETAQATMPVDAEAIANAQRGVAGLSSVEEIYAEYPAIASWPENQQQLFIAKHWLSSIGMDRQFGALGNTDEQVDTALFLLMDSFKKNPETGQTKAEFQNRARRNPAVLGQVAGSQLAGFEGGVSLAAQLGGAGLDELLGTKQLFSTIAMFTAGGPKGLGRPPKAMYAAAKSPVGQVAKVPTLPTNRLGGGGFGAATGLDVAALEATEMVQAVGKPLMAAARAVGQAGEKAIDSLPSARTLDRISPIGVADAAFDPEDAAAAARAAGDVPSEVIPRTKVEARTVLGANGEFKYPASPGDNVGFRNDKTGEILSYEEALIALAKDAPAGIELLTLGNMVSGVDAAGKKFIRPERAVEWLRTNGWREVPVTPKKAVPELPPTTSATGTTAARAAGVGNVLDPVPSRTVAGRVEDLSNLSPREVRQRLKNEHGFVAEGISDEQQLKTLRKFEQSRADSAAAHEQIRLDVIEANRRADEAFGQKPIRDVVVEEPQRALPPPLAGGGVPRGVSGAVTGQPFEGVQFRGFGRETAEELFSSKAGAQENIFGDAVYSTPSEGFAKEFGPNIEQVTTRLENPLVISTDTEYAALAREAGLRSSAPATSEEVNALRAVITGRGHDGVIIRVPESELTGKRLQQVFGDDTVVDFSGVRPDVTAARGIPEDAAAAARGAGVDLDEKLAQDLTIKDPDIFSPQGQISPTQRGELPRYWYHYRVSPVAEDGGINATRIRQPEAADMFGANYAEGEYIWLSPTPIRSLEDSVIVDISKLTNSDIRSTGQFEGNILHRGNIPKSAIVDPPTTPATGTAAADVAPTGQAAALQVTPQQQAIIDDVGTGALPADDVAVDAARLTPEQQIEADVAALRGGGGGELTFAQANEALETAKPPPPEGPVARPIAVAGEPPRKISGVPDPTLNIGKQGILLEVPPTEIGENLLDLRPIQIRELGVVDRAVNAARATLGKLTNKEVVLKNKLVKSAFDEVRRAQPRITSQKNLLAANIDRIKVEMRRSGTVFDKNGRIQRLAGVDPGLGSTGGPTIQDLAARRPRYLASLTDAERQALEDMRLQLEPWRNAMDEVGLEVSGRSDLVAAADPTEAGFYMPRGGNPATPDMPRSTRGAGGKIGAEKRASFASMAEALDEGATYFPLGDSIANHGQSMGERLANLHAANFLQRLEVETGIPLGRAGGKPLPGELGLPSGSAVPSLRELQGTTFPPEITNAVNEILATQGELIGKGSEILKAINAYNNFYRGARSTFDNSAIMIQGLLGSATDPAASARGLVLNAEIWKTGEARAIFGRFVAATDQHAADVLGIDDFSSVAAQKGLILNGGETELTQSAITRIPGVRRAANAFGFYGDALRLGWLGDEVAIEMARTGKTGRQIVDDGTLERLANAINPATGVTEGNRVTDLASIATFAPRFLQSRLITVARGIRGLDVDAPLDILPSSVRRRIPIREAPLNPAARLEDRIARKALIRLAGYWVGITVGANAAQGEETDFRLFVNGRPNPNFVRVRFGERDFSVGGTWDSILKLIVGTAQGISQGNINTILGSARGLGSGLTTQAWDLISRRDFEGRETTSSPLTFAAHVTRSHLPFQAEELPAAGGKIVEGVREGDIGQVATGAAQIALEAHGSKSSPLSGKDQLDIATQSGNFSADNFDDIEPFEQNEVRDAVGDVFRDRGTPQDVFFDGIDQIENREPGTLGESDVGGREPRRAQLLAQAGTLKNNEIIDEWFSIESDAAAERNGLRLGTGLEFDAERDEGEKLIEQWFAIFGIPSVRDKIGKARFTELDKQRKAFLARLNPVQREFLLRNTHLRPVDPKMMTILEMAGARGTVKNIRDSEAARDRFRANPQRTDLGEVAPSTSAPTPQSSQQPQGPVNPFSLGSKQGQQAPPLPGSLQKSILVPAGE